MISLPVRLAFSSLALCCASILSAQAPAAAPAAFALKQCTKLPLPRQMHGCAVLGTRVYVFGGATTKQWENDVLSADITPDGNLGQWRPELAMPERRHYISNSVEVVNNRIYVIGGAVAPQPGSTEAQNIAIADVLWTSVKPDSTLNPWRKSTPMPTGGLSSAATSSNDQHLFVLGGRSGGVISSDVIVGDFAADGNPTNFRTVAKMPVSLWFHGAAILDERLYVWGGLTGTESSTINRRVFTAAVNADGSLGPWQEMPPMPQGIYSSAFSGFNDYLVSIGGRYVGGTPTRDIVFSRLVNGVPQTWQTLTTDLETRVYQSLGLDKSRGWIFVTGGRFREAAAAKSGKLIENVQAFQLTQPKQSALVLAKQPASTSPGTAQPAPAAGNATASPAAQGGSIGSGVKFYSARDAVAEAAKTKKPIILFFYSPEVPACKRLWEDISKLPTFATVANNYIWAAVDTSKEDRQLMYHFSIFKVPSMLMANPQGAIVKKADRLANAQDFARFTAP